MDNKRGISHGLLAGIGVVLVLVLIGAMFFYFSLAGPNYDSAYQSKNLKDPTAGLSQEQAEAKFDESFVYYFLYSVKAYNLHNPPLSSNKPKMEFIVGEDVYNVIIDKGEIIIDKGSLDNRDAVIRTNAKEAVKMIKDINYIKESFRNGDSSIELTASKSELFSKGYLGLYTEITGQSLSGNVIRIYTK
mgnify:CR=1 FL=1